MNTLSVESMMHHTSTIVAYSAVFTIFVICVAALVKDSSGLESRPQFIDYRGRVRVRVRLRGKARVRVRERVMSRVG